MYYSRDGAKSFKFFKNGAHFADVINHGSYVVLLPKSGLPHLEWTEDEGQTWHSCRILPSDGIESIKIINTYSDNGRSYLLCSHSSISYNNVLLMQTYLEYGFMHQTHKATI